MKISITGVNHKTAPLDVRERLSFGRDALPRALQHLRSREGVAEGMILSTCNRVEVAVTAADELDARKLIADFLAAERQVSAASIADHLYCHEGDTAIRHLFRVASSLDSMVVGEPQILGQLKEAYAVAKAEGAVCGVLDALVTRAFSVAKRVRTETAIAKSAVSVSYAAVELARQIFGRLDDKTVMIIGAGKMSELAARHLRRAGATQVFVTNRTHDRAVELARIFQGSVVGWDTFKNDLPKVDILIASSGAPHYILSKDDLKRVVEARRNRPVFLIDIAVPRNIDPAVNDLDNVFLYDIDDLQEVIDENLRARRQEAQDAEAIIEEEAERMIARLRAKEVSPTIVSLQQCLEDLRQAELERMQGKLALLSPEQREAVDSLTRCLINKIAHGPIREIRQQAAQPNGGQSIEVIRRAFRLDS